MKKLIVSFLFASFSMIVFGQSVTLLPTGDEISIQSYGAANGGSFYGKNAGGTPSSPTGTSANSPISILGARGFNGNLYPTASQGLIGVFANQNFTPNATGTTIRFETTANNTTNRVERMRIAHNGNVGIGTNTPTAKLDISGDIVLSSKKTLGGPFPPTIYDLDREGSSVIKINGQRVIYGIAGGTDGLIIYIYLTPGSDLEIKHNSALSIAGNRILWSGNIYATSLSLLDGGAVTMIYDGLAGAGSWRILSVFKF